MPCGPTPTTSVPGYHDKKGTLRPDAGYDLLVTSAAVVRAIEPILPTLPDQQDYDVLVLPREVTEDGVGRYHDSLIDVVKALRAEGLSARFAHDPQERKWIGEKSAAQYAIDFIFSIGTSAAYDGIKAMLQRRHKEAPVRVRLTRRFTVDGETSEWLEIDGTGDQVAAVIDQLGQNNTQPGEHQ